MRRINNELCFGELVSNHDPRLFSKVRIRFSSRKKGKKVICKNNDNYIVLSGLYLE